MHEILIMWSAISAALRNIVPASSAALEDVLYFRKRIKQQRMLSVHLHL